MTIRTLIVDDEPLARRRIRALLRAAPDVDVIGECGDGGAAVDAIRAHAPDLVFLDVQMPAPDGFGVVSAVGVDRMPVVIFVTAYDQHALRAFEVHALDYLLKPFDRDRFLASLARARNAVTHARAGDLRRDLQALLNEHADHGAPPPNTLTNAPPNALTRGLTKEPTTARTTAHTTAPMDAPIDGPIDAPLDAPSRTSSSAPIAARHASRAAPPDSDAPIVIRRSSQASGPAPGQTWGDAPASWTHPIDRLVVRSTGRIAMVRVDEIDWIQAESNYVRLHVDKRSYLLRETISALETRLAASRFRRIHRSTIVNLDRIQELQPSFRGDYIVLLRDGRRLTLSRSYRDRLPELFGPR